MPAAVRIDHREHAAVLFDLDGVITDTASVHSKAWKDLFDQYLDRRQDDPDEDHSPFTDDDYRRYVDGKRRIDGVTSFLESRGITLPEGRPSDDEDDDTVHGLGNRKNRYFRQRLERDGVTVFHSTVTLVHRLQGAGIGTAVFSSSRNCQPVLDAAGLGELFEVRVDGVVADELDLPGKPDPAMLLEASARLEVEPGCAVVVEDSSAGVRAGDRGGFALVIGVDRDGHAEQLSDSGADAVVNDLAQVELHGPGQRLSAVPPAEDRWQEITDLVRRRPTALFLDFDGTLADIVEDPDAATLAEGGQEALRGLTRWYPVAVISGRGLDDLLWRVDVEGLWHAGSHGFELHGPVGERHEHDAAEDALPALSDAASALDERLDDIPGVKVERKRFAVAVHFRNVGDDRVDEVVNAVDEIGGASGDLRITGGRQVRELRPDVAWDKGEAVRWLLGRMHDDERAIAVYIGDDLTDEDALEVVHGSGIGIVVRSEEHGDRSTAAHFSVPSPEAVRDLLRRLEEPVAPDTER